MGMNLETCQTQKSYCLACLLHSLAAIIQRQDAIIQALHPYLHLGHPQITEPAKFIGRHVIRTRFNDQAYIAPFSGNIDQLDAD